MIYIAPVLEESWHVDKDILGKVGLCSKVNLNSEFCKIPTSGL